MPQYSGLIIKNIMAKFFYMSIASFLVIAILEPLYHSVEALLSAVELLLVLDFCLHGTKPSVPCHCFQLIAGYDLECNVAAASGVIVSAVEVVELGYLKNF